MSNDDQSHARLGQFATIGLCPSCRNGLAEAVESTSGLTCARCGGTVRVEAGVVLALSVASANGWAAGITADMDQKSTSYVGKYEQRTRASNGFLIRRELALDLAGARPGRVLEPGCGPGVVSPLLSERGVDTHGVDLSGGQLRTAAARDPSTLYVRGDLEKLPYQSGTFDTVVLLGALEYVEKPEQVMRELARVLTPRGRLIVTVPNARSLARLWTHYVYLPLARTAKRALRRPVSAYSRRLYSLKRFTSLLESVGLAPEETRFFDIELAAPPLERLLGDRPPKLAGRLEERLRGPLRRALSTQIMVRAKRVGA